MRKNISLALILSSAMTLTTVAVAAPSGKDAGASHQRAYSHHQRGYGHHHGHGMMNFKKLDLTDTQRASIKQIYKTSHAQNKPQREALHQQRAAFRSMTPDQVGYQKAASVLAQTEGNATQQRVQQRADVRAQVYAVLTPTQKAKLASMRSEREARHTQWKQFKAQHPVSATSASSAQ